MKQYILSDVAHAERTYGRLSAFSDEDARKRAEILGYNVAEVITGTDDIGVVVVDCQTAVRAEMEGQSSGADSGASPAGEDASSA